MFEAISDFILEQQCIVVDIDFKAVIKTVHKRIIALSDEDI